MRMLSALEKKRYIFVGRNVGTGPPSPPTNMPPFNTASILHPLPPLHPPFLLSFLSHLLDRLFTRLHVKMIGVAQDYLAAALPHLGHEHKTKLRILYHSKNRSGEKRRVNKLIIDTGEWLVRFSRRRAPEKNIRVELRFDGETCSNSTTVWYISPTISLQSQKMTFALRTSDIRFPHLPFLHWERRMLYIS